MLEFLTKFEFLNKILRRGESRQSAKERLRLVLIHDRASVSPQIMESLKVDLIQIISKYLEIDVNELEIGLEQKDGSYALAASIPIKKVKRAPDSAPPQEDAEPEKQEILPSLKAESLSAELLPDTPGAVEKGPEKPPKQMPSDTALQKRASSRSKRKSRNRRFSEKRGGAEPKR